jgi:hypothetical protein
MFVSSIAMLIGLIPLVPVDCGYCTLALCCQPVACQTCIEECVGAEDNAGILFCGGVPRSEGALEV